MCHVPARGICRGTLRPSLACLSFPYPLPELHNIWFACNGKRIFALWLPLPLNNPVVVFVACIIKYHCCRVDIFKIILFEMRINKVAANILINFILLMIYIFCFGQHSIRRYLENGVIVVQYEEKPTVISPPGKLAISIFLAKRWIICFLIKQYFYYQ